MPFIKQFFNLAFFYLSNIMNIYGGAYMPNYKNADAVLPHQHGEDKEKIIKDMPSEETVRSVSDTLKQLGDPSRLRIFWFLCHCEECVINIAALTDMSSPAVSHHLRLLKASGLIVSRREGKEMYYKAADTDMVKSLHRTVERIANISCPG